MKLLGLAGPKTALDDSVVLDSLKLKKGKKFVMLGEPLGLLSARLSPGVGYRGEGRTDRSEMGED